MPSVNQLLHQSVDPGVKSYSLVAPLGTFATTSELRHCFTGVEPSQAQDEPLSRS